MANAVKENTSYAVVIEDTEGTYKAPVDAESYVQVLRDGAEMTFSQELLSRDIFTGSIGKTQSRLGTRSASGALPVELRTGDDEGENPEAHPLFVSALGEFKERAAVTTKTGNATNQLEIEDADISGFAVNDVIVVEEAGDFQFSWVQSVDTTGGAAHIVLGKALSAAPADNVTVRGITQYTAANSGHPSLSVSKYIEGARLEQVTGARVTSMSIENFSTGQIASVNFGFEGLSFDSSLTASPFTPNYDAALPPIILNACIYQDGTQIEVNDFSLSLENTLGFVTSTCSSNGRTSSRVTSRAITGTVNPYKQDDSVDQFNKFKCNTPYTLFVTGYNPTLDANCEPTGEFTNAFAILLTNCITTELGESDADGLLVNDISFEATRGPQGNEEEMKIGFM